MIGQEHSYEIKRMSSPVVDYEKVWREQWDDTARYGPAHRHRRRILKRLVCGLPHARVLDVGCGDGSLLRELSRAMSGEFSGMDISAHAIEQARKQNPGMSFRIVDLSGDLEIEDQDIVVLSEVLEHLDHDEALLRRIAAGTRYVVVSVPGGATDNVDRRYGHVRNYAGDLLRLTLEKCGFEVVYMRRWGWPFYDWVQSMSGGAAGIWVTKGVYGSFRKIVAWAVYCLFFMNILPYGTQLFAVGKVRSRQVSTPHQ